MDKKYFKKILGKIAGKKIVVIGDVMLDKYIFGFTRRMAPEAKVPIVDAESESYILGGAANVANNLAELGCKVFLVGMLGKDEAGNKLKDLAEDRKIKLEVEEIDTHPTTLKTRIFTAGKYILRVDNESRDLISKDAEKKTIETLNRLIPSCNALVISDYSKGFITPNLSQSTIKTAHKYSKKIVVDPKDNFLLYKRASLMKPNVFALKKFAAMGIRNNEDLKLAANKLLKKLSLEALLVTEAEKGMTLFQKNDKPFHVDSLAKNVVDVTGAGDSVLAALAACLAAGASYPAAAKLANLAGAIKVGKASTSVVSKKELEFNLNLLT